MAKSTPPVLQHKDLGVSGVKVLSEEEGIVEAFVSGIGNKDSVGDIIQPGAFNDSIAAMKPKGVWSHNWDRPVSKTLEIYEVEAGDSRLPQKMKTAGIGGLYVKTQFNLDTQDGRDAFSWVKFYDDESEWSIGYQTLDEEYDKKKKANLLHKVKLFEYSPVLFGANPLTATVGVKVDVVSNGEESDVKIEIQGLPEGEQKAAITAALEAAVKAELQEDATDGDVSEKDAVTDGAPTEEVEAHEEADEKSSEDASDTEATGETDAQEKESEGVTEDTTDPEPAEEKEEDAEAASDEPVAEKDEEEDPSEEEDESDDDDDEAGSEKTALSAVVESFMTYAEKAEFTPAEAKALDTFVAERTEVKTVEGSVEQRLRKIDQALRDSFEGRDSYVYLYATFDSTVVFYKAEFGGESGFYEASYTIGDEGVEFGEEKSVDVVEVVVAKHAVMEAAFKGHTDGVKSSLAPFVDASEGVEGDAEIKQAIIDGIEIKAGAKLSKSNRGLIEAAVESLEKVLGAADDEDADEKDAETEEVETKDDDAEAEVEVKDDESTEADTKEAEEAETAGQKADEADEDDAPLTIDSSELDELKALAAQFLSEDD